MGCAPLLVLVVMQPSEGEYNSVLACIESDPRVAGRYGFTSRQWGMTLDNVVAATVVLANGTIVNASSTEQPDLYWVSLS